jgi:hypothetical protein
MFDKEYAVMPAAVLIADHADRRIAELEANLSAVEAERDRLRAIVDKLPRRVSNHRAEAGHWLAVDAERVRSADAALARKVSARSAAREVAK